MPELLQIAPVSQPTEAHDAQRIRSLPVLVLNLHSRCNCRCVMCDIWKTTEAHEFSVTDLERQLDSIRQLGVRWVVLTGGEPLLHSHLSCMLSLLRAEKIRITLLTTGLLLQRYADLVASNIDDVIISLDGPPAVHDQIRRVPDAFARMKQGFISLRERNSSMEIGLRLTVQRANHKLLRASVETAKDLRASWISLLAADLTSTAFNRKSPWSSERRAEVGLSMEEVAQLEQEIELLIRDHKKEIATGFIREDARKLRRILSHFKAALGLQAPVAPVCNAPWVSAVLETDGSVRPCFFHPAIGNVNRGALADVINNQTALRFRDELNIDENPTCQRCVCSLNFRSERT